MTRRPVTGLFLVLGFWAAALVLIHPVGNFPLMDDWGYAPKAGVLATQGTLQVAPFMEATGVAHLFWGALFIWVGGHSHEVLRLSTVVLAAAAIVGVWRLASEAGATAATAALAAAVFAFNPVGLELATTFMTDVPFACWSTWACLWFLKALTRPSWRAILLATGFSVIATFGRQLGLAWPLAFLAGALIAWRPSRSRLLMSVTPACLTCGSLILYSEWVTWSGRGWTSNFNVILAQGLQEAWVTFFKITLNIGFHFGWYVLPAVIWTARRFDCTSWIRWLWVPVVGALIASVGKVAPWGSSILYDFGIGPPMVRGWNDPGGSSFPTAPYWLWMVWTIGTAVGIVALVIRVARHFWRPWPTTAAARTDLSRGVFLVGGILIYLAPLVWGRHFYDRYLVPSLPVTIALCVYLSRTQVPSSLARRVAVGLVSVYAAFGVLAAHDYFAFSRARWTAIHDLEASGRYGRNEIDGGFEYSGLYGFHRPGQGLAADLPNARVIVALQPLPGTTACSQVMFRRWMPPRWDAVWVVGVDRDACP